MREARWLKLHLYDGVPADADWPLENRTVWYPLVEAITDIVEHGAYRSVSTKGNMAQVIETAEEIMEALDLHHEEAASG